MPMRAFLTTILEVVGITAACVGVFLVNVPAGLIVSGISAVAVGALEGRK